MNIRLVKEISVKQREWRNNLEMMAFFRQSQYLSEEDQRRWTQKIENDTTIEMFGVQVIPKQERTGKVLWKNKPFICGTTGLTGISFIHRTAEWSLLIGPEHQGNGYGTAALKLLLDYGFNWLGLECIWGEIFEHNKRSLKIAEKVGFQIEGTLRSRYFKEGKRISTQIASILRPEWNAMNAGPLA